MTKKGNCGEYGVHSCNNFEKAFSKLADAVSSQREMETREMETREKGHEGDSETKPTVDVSDKPEPPKPEPPKPDLPPAVPDAQTTQEAPKERQTRTTRFLCGRKDILRLVAVPLIVVLASELLQSEKMTRYLSKFVGSSVFLRIARAAILAVVTGLCLLLFR